MAGSARMADSGRYSMFAKKWSRPWSGASVREARLSGEYVTPRGAQREEMTLMREGSSVRVTGNGLEGNDVFNLCGEFDRRSSTLELAKNYDEIDDPSVVESTCYTGLVKDGRWQGKWSGPGRSQGLFSLTIDEVPRALSGPAAKRDKSGNRVWKWRRYKCDSCKKHTKDCRCTKCPKCARNSCDNTAHALAKFSYGYREYVKKDGSKLSVRVDFNQAQAEQAQKDKKRQTEDARGKNADDKKR